MSDFPAALEAIAEGLPSLGLQHRCEHMRCPHGLALAPIDAVNRMPKYARACVRIDTSLYTVKHMHAHICAPPHTRTHSNARHIHTHRNLKGGLTLEQRKQAVAAFQTDPPTTIFLLSMRAGAVGLTLTGEGSGMAHSAISTSMIRPAPRRSLALVGMPLT
jgi:hypothetical protein